MKLQPGNQAAYRDYIDRLRQLVVSEQAALLTIKQRDQLLAARSNATFLEERLRRLAADHLSGDLRANVPDDLRAWETSINKLIEGLLDEGPPGSVFTRDVDQGELVGQSSSGDTMSATYRIPRQIGRLRNIADFNRGGAAGSYVRFLSCRPRLRSQGEPSTSALLGVGSVGNSGITIVYDALSIVLHNAAPANLFHNSQDSAGRVFGTAAIDEQALRRQGKASEKVLGQANPNYWRRDQGGVPESTLDDDYILGEARTGLILLTLQVRLGQTDREEYNEQILFTGAPVTSIKAILVHRPAVGPGRPPERQEVPGDRVQKLRQREADRRTQEEAALAEVKQEREGLERFIRALRGPSQWRKTEAVSDAFRNAYARISELVAAESRLKRSLLLERPVQTQRWVPHIQPRTDRILRGHVAWENDALPESLHQFANKVGHNGVPIRFLFRHVNPQAIKREKIPALAAEVHASGLARWQQVELNRS